MVRETVDQEAAPALAVADLSVTFAGASGPARVVTDVGFEVSAGETIGLVGESGSGKSVTALSILGLIQEQANAQVSGRVSVNGREFGAATRSLRGLRGRHVGMIFQEPRRSLDPAFSVGSQIAEIARSHLGLARRDAWDRAVAMLDRVGIDDAASRAKDYPHMLSGGMCQRVLIAMALVASPRVLLADEPTTALDVTVQARVLDLLQDLQDEMGLAIVLITHDLSIVASMCRRTAVMYAGQVVEWGDTASLFEKPSHPYTEGLLASLPQRQAGARMGSIPGVVPSPDQWPSGCRFAPRCTYAVERCTEGLPLLEPAGASVARCIRQGELDLGGVE